MTSQNTIPLKLVILLQEIEKRGLNTEGIYRKQSSTEKINNLKLILDSNTVEKIDLVNYEVILLCSMVKLFFRQLPTPLFPSITSIELLKIIDIFEVQDKKNRILQIISKLPNPNHVILDRMLFHFNAIKNNNLINKMCASNLSIVFAPCFFDYDLSTNIDQIKILENQKK